MRRPDYTCLPPDLAALYAGEPDSKQLALQVDTAEAEFRRWLLEQAQPEWMDAA